MQTIVRLGVLAVAMVLTSSGLASELNLHLGASKADPFSKTTYSWALEYRHRLADHLSGSVSWLNEGHVPGHHRDGQAAQLWWHTDPAGRRPRFELGIGPYRYYDTVNAANTDGYANYHGWGLIASAGSTWNVGERWLASLRLNRIHGHDSIKSTAIVAGVGYRFGPMAKSASETVKAFRRSELDVMAGATRLNSFDSSDLEVAGGLAWRVRVNDYLTGSLTYLDEGNMRGGRRAGFAPQLWLEDAVTDRLAVGVGLGPYFASRHPLTATGGRTSTTSALISVTASWSITPDWTGRVIWNRVSTSYDRDADVLMFGLGYRF